MLQTYYIEIMKDEHLSLRLPGDLAEALAEEAKARGVAKSFVVREAVSTYLGGVDSSRSAEHTLLARDFARIWATLPVLERDEARAFADDIEDARKAIVPPIAPPIDLWE